MRMSALSAAGLVVLVAAGLVASASSVAGASGVGGWCGSAEAAADRLPDSVAAQQIHVVYAVPSDGEDRFATDAPLIVSDLTALDAWWRGQDPTRTPRFDLFAFPGCGGGLPALDLSSIRLPHDADYYRGIAQRPARLGADLAPAFADPAKKYLVYYDAPVDAPFDCGQSAIAPDSGGAKAYSFIYLQDEGCTHDLGAGEGDAGYAAVQLIHNLGAVPDAAPHVCYEHSVCDWYWDVEMQFPTGDPIAKLILDYGRDDYYGHAGAWFDVQDSPWLSHVGAPQYELEVTQAGRGHGTVTSDLPGISCPGTCSMLWEHGARFTLRATALAGSRFLHWGGDCTGANDCAVTMVFPRRVAAIFAPEVVTLSVSMRGRGELTSSPPGLACPGRCSAQFPSGVTVRVRARPAHGWRFAQWSGACRGRGPCFVYQDDDRRAAAVFRRG